MAPGFIGAYVVSFSTEEFKHPILSNFNCVLAIYLTSLVICELASINSTSDTYDPYDILFSILGAGAALITFTFLNPWFKE
ncbi:MAG: Trk-type K+ transport system membrane component [Cyclobacteriaceae bacterium]